VDAVLRGSDAQRHEPLIGGTKGSHLVVEWPAGPTHAIFASAKSDGRPFFILPWYLYTLIGTTDLRFEGDPSKAEATADEVAYLLDEANRLFPSSPLAAADVLYTYSGVRPLPYTRDGKEGSITRSHLVLDHAKTGGPNGLLSVVGGKLTTYQSLSRAAVRAIAKHAAPSGAAAREEARAPRDAPATDVFALYGDPAPEVRAMSEADAALREPICEHNPEVLAQVAYAVEREQALTLGDVLLRRLPVGWSKCHALDGAARAAAVMAQRLGWDAARCEREVEGYRAEVARTLVRVT
jgi:glycerol-3-phosphate dehydrogenase